MVALGRPDRAVPGAYEADVRPFDGAIAPSAYDVVSEENLDFAIEILDQFRTAVLEA